MDRQDWLSVYEPIPDALEIHVGQTLAQLDNTPQVVPRPPLRRLALVLALLLALGGVAYAIYESITADLFGWFYGGSWKQELQNGNVAPMSQSYQLGQLSYTLEEMVYKTQGEFQGLYGVVRITPAKGANVVLLPDDLSVNDPAGYLLHYGDTGQTIPSDAPSYAQLAAQQGAKLLMARAAVNTVSINGQPCTADFGEAWLPQPDGTLLGTMELVGDVPLADSYELCLWLSNWEVTPEGLWLRDEPDSTWLQYDWTVTVTPEKEAGA